MCHLHYKKLVKGLLEKSCAFVSGFMQVSVFMAVVKFAEGAAHSLQTLPG